MEQVSVFDILKIGIGPSSSHTLGPWKAADSFISNLINTQKLDDVHQIKTTLYGSLALTGKGHGTDFAIILGLIGEDPESIPKERVSKYLSDYQTLTVLSLRGTKSILFNADEDITFNYKEVNKGHPNALEFIAADKNGNAILKETYFSIGGGFIVKDIDIEKKTKQIGHLAPYALNKAADILKACVSNKQSIAELVFEHESVWRTQSQTESKLLNIWRVMLNSIYSGCHTKGELPGGLKVQRRAHIINQKLLGDLQYDTSDEWVSKLKSSRASFSNILKWVSCFAMAVNEENASFGRIVTAPTNGSAGVIPAVLFYHICSSEKEVSDKDICNFLAVASSIGMIFKKGATISAAMGGCQAEIGVSSAMAAAALTELMGGSVEQSLMAAEIAMEHHLGMTCDPINGLVQIPCIERNAMGAIKAITASNLALENDPAQAKVFLDEIIQTMWDTAKDMNSKYKETSLGGMAINVSVKVSEC